MEEAHAGARRASSPRGLHPRSKTQRAPTRRPVEEAHAPRAVCRRSKTQRAPTRRPVEEAHAPRAVCRRSKTQRAPARRPVGGARVAARRASSPRGLQGSTCSPSNGRPPTPGRGRCNRPACSFNSLRGNDQREERGRSSSRANCANPAGQARKTGEIGRGADHVPLVGSVNVRYRTSFSVYIVDSWGKVMREYRHGVSKISTVAGLACAFGSSPAGGPTERLSRRDFSRLAPSGASRASPSRCPSAAGFGRG